MIQASLSSKDQSSLQLNASMEGSPLPDIKFLNSKSISSRSLTNLISASDMILNRSRKNSLRSDQELEVVIHRDDSPSNILINRDADESYTGLQTPKMNRKTLNKPQYGTYLHVPGTKPAVVSDQFRGRCNSDSKMTGLAVNMGASGFDRSDHAGTFSSTHMSVSDEDDQCPKNKSVYFSAHA